MPLDRSNSRKRNKGCTYTHIYAITQNLLELQLLNVWSMDKWQDMSKREGTKRPLCLLMLGSLSPGHTGRFLSLQVFTCSSPSLLRNTLVSHTHTCRVPHWWPWCMCVSVWTTFGVFSGGIHWVALAVYTVYSARKSLQKLSNTEVVFFKTLFRYIKKRKKKRWINKMKSCVKLR